ncbi:uncharacterized protein LOC130692811 [Daphnia carinata]|uniref:uncharacterized protein LOC130692811 n=1 Tax=Daphnia carinata TaxID=120202 RepID=UPI00257B7647|nr:uncharacterized protein LOC130692811 [Daphnia carinata]
MCRLGFILIFGALALLTNLQRADSFSHNRLNTPALTHDTDSLEHNDDSNEGTGIQPETSIAQSDEDHLNSEENKIVKRDSRFLKKRDVHQIAKTIFGRIDSSEEDTTDGPFFDSRSDEHSDEKRIVKRDVLQARGDRSSEEDTTESATVGSHSDEHDDISLEDNRLVKRDIRLVAVDRSSEEDTTAARLLTSDHSSEEQTTDSVLDRASLEDSVEDALVRSPLNVKLLPSTALRI